MNRFECYELCVQSPRHVTQLLRDLYARNQSGASPSVLREDFCGTAAVSRRWVRDGHASGVQARAVGVDLDPDTLDHARAAVHQDDLARWVELRRQDCVHVDVDPGDGCDVIFVGNFSIGYIHDRTSLVGYLRRSRERLDLGNAGFGGGVFVCDIYDSPRRFDLGCVHRRHPSRGKEIVLYTWEHRHADVFTGMVENAVHFRIEVDGVIEQEMFDAFVYRWRLWSLVELRDAMHEAGFSRVEVFAEVSSGAKPVESGSEMPESGVVCLGAWA